MDSNRRPPGGTSLKGASGGDVHDDGVTMIWVADPEWTEDDQNQLLRLLFGPRLTPRVPERTSEEPRMLAGLENMKSPTV